MTKASADESLLQIIERFNRKERYIVFQQATSEGAVTLTEAFRGELDAALSWDVPEDVLVLTDYHLTWLYAALEMHAGEWASEGSENKAERDVPSVTVVVDGQEKTRSAIERNQEDIDLLLAWESRGETHVGLIEVKAYSSWSNPQLASKAARLEAIFGGDGKAYSERNVVPHFALMSFNAPKGIKTNRWPVWMCPDGTTAHLTISSGDAPSRLAVGQVDGAGRPSDTGDYYEIREVNP